MWGGHSNGRKRIKEMVSNTSHTWFPCVRYQSIHSILAIIMSRPPLTSLQWGKAREAHLEVWCSSVWIGIWALLWEPKSPCTVMWVEGRRKLFWHLNSNIFRLPLSKPTFFQWPLKKYPTLHLQFPAHLGQYSLDRLFPVTKWNNNNVIWHLQGGNAFPFQS